MPHTCGDSNARQYLEMMNVYCWTMIDMETRGLGSPAEILLATIAEYPLIALLKCNGKTETHEYQPRSSYTCVLERDA